MAISPLWKRWADCNMSLGNSMRGRSSDRIRRLVICSDARFSCPEIIGTGYLTFNGRLCCEVNRAVVHGRVSGVVTEFFEEHLGRNATQR